VSLNKELRSDLERRIKVKSIQQISVGTHVLQKVKNKNCNGCSFLTAEAKKKPQTTLQSKPNFQSHVFKLNNMFNVRKFQ
jgi:hypothetical protein